LNPRPLGYETYDDRLPRLAASLVTALASANLRQQVSRGLACFPHLTASRPVRFTNPFTDPVPWPAPIPARRTRTPADHPVPPAPHSGDPSRGGARISKVLAVTGHAEFTGGERADVSRQTRTPRVRGSVPAAPASASRPLPVAESYRSIDPDLVPFEQNAELERPTADVTALASVRRLSVLSASLPIH
jgi:hypothetical protein